MGRNRGLWPGRRVCPEPAHTWLEAKVSLMFMRCRQAVVRREARMNGKWEQNRGDLVEKRMTIETPAPLAALAKLGHMHGA